MRVRSLVCKALPALAALLSIAPAAAQAPGAEPEPGAASEGESITPPRLSKAVQATPPGGVAPETEVAVLLELSIDEAGKVVEATVVESGGEDFDRAALEAVKQFEFEPARRGETPLAVTIRYRYAFAARAPEPAPDPVPPPAPELAPEKPVAEEPPKAPAPAASDDLVEYEAVAEVEAPPREVTRRAVEKEELTRIPGTRGDALRAVEVMPGVARTGIDEGTPILRGAAWNESQAFLEGAPVPFLYHFGGVTSFINSRLLERVDLYPGNFSTRYGRLAGGVIEVSVRDPRRDRFAAVLDLNLIDSSVLVETPLGESWSMALAARRSNIDFFFENFVPEDAYSVVAAPTYYDYQAIASHRFGGDGRLLLMAYGSRDSVELLFADPADEDPALSGSIGAKTELHRIQAQLESRLSRSVAQESSLTAGYLDLEFRFGELVQAFGGLELHGRSEWSFEASPAVRLTAGADFFGWFLEGEYRGPPPGGLEGDTAGRDPLVTRELVSVDETRFDVVRPGGYAELALRPTDALLLLPGVRVDYFEDLRDFAVDPRFNARYDFGQGTTLKAGVGRYTQAPEFYQAFESVGNPNIEPYYAIHTGAGVEQRFGKALRVGVEGFYKWLDNRPVPTPGGEPPRYLNEGQGRIYGAEVSAEARPDAQTFGYLAYTLSRSERRDLDRRWRLFDQDQTHILSLALSRELGKGWEIGARFRLVSGNPDVPIVSSVYDARTGVYVPVYGAVNSVRSPTFHQLDVRVEKKFQIGPLLLAPYLDVQNVYNAENVEGRSYSYDYRESETVSGLPFFPNLGLRGEL